jgi:hypothetical protein
VASVRVAGISIRLGDIYAALADNEEFAINGRHSPVCREPMVLRLM